MPAKCSSFNFLFILLSASLCLLLTGPGKSFEASAKEKSIWSHAIPPGWTETAPEAPEDLLTITKGDSNYFTFSLMEDVDNDLPRLGIDKITDLFFQETMGGMQEVADESGLVLESEKSEEKIGEYDFRVLLLMLSSGPDTKEPTAYVMVQALAEINGKIAIIGLGCDEDACDDAIEELIETILSSYPRQPESASGGSAKEAVENKIGPTVDINAFIIRLQKSDGGRFLRTTLTLELDSEKTVAEVEKRMVQIKATIRDIAAKKTASELKSTEGKKQLMRAWLDGLNSLLQSGTVKDLYVIDFVLR